MKFAVMLLIIFKFIPDQLFAQDTQACVPYPYSTEQWSGYLIDSSGNRRIINDSQLKDIINNKIKQNKEHTTGVAKGWNFQKANLNFACLEGIRFGSGAHFEGARLSHANLKETSFWHGYLQKTNLSSANLEKSNLQLANLQGANLTGANLKGADLSYANLDNVIFEISSEGLPDINLLSNALNISKMKYLNSPTSLIILKDSFKKMGLKRQEKEVIYAIKHSEILNAISGLSSKHVDDLSSTYYGGRINFTTKIGLIFVKIEAIFKWIFFDLTCKWGMNPERPLFIIFGFIFLFSVPYGLSLSQKKKKDGIWKIWPEERVRHDLGSKRPELIRVKQMKALQTALYFSLLSAFNIGWRDLNIGGWIYKIQPKEYRLQATGWVRSFSGLQSLISVYLLALSVITYLGRPFG